MKTIAAITLLLLAALPAGAQDATPPASPPAEVELLPQESNKVYFFGESLKIVVRGRFLTEITNRMTTSNSSAEKVLQFHLNGVHVPRLRCAPEREVVNKIQETVLNVTLDRDTNDQENREAWDKVLHDIDGLSFERAINLAVGVVGSVPVDVGDVTIAVNGSFRIYLVLIGCGVAFALSLWGLVGGSHMLRDAGAGTAYSLGKTQMAFWGLVVVFCFIGVWLITMRMERIPSQVLVLIGISGSTGLAALVIGNNKQADASKNLQKALIEDATLKAIPAAAQTPADQLRLSQLPAEITRLTNESKPASTSGSFWTDLCTDDNGLSFHRLQIVAWTVVLGVIFIQSVICTLSMPEFSETLLTLMGISNSTYLGFKIPEKQ